MTALRPKVRAKVRKVVTALGVGATLEQWGFARADITELDWFDSRSFSANSFSVNNPDSANEVTIHTILQISLMIFSDQTFLLTAKQIENNYHSQLVF